MTSTNPSRIVRPRRIGRTSGFVAVSASLALLLAACGDAEQAAVSTVTAGAPPVIQVVPGSGGASLGATGAQAAADDSTMVDPMAMTRLAWVEYVLGVDLPELDSEAPAWRLVPGDVDPAAVAAIAAALGLEGELTDLPEDWGAGWIIGPTDGTAPSLSVSRDGMLSWWYSSGPGEASAGCAMPVEPVVEPLPVDPVVDPVTDKVVEESVEASDDIAAGESGGGTDGTDASGEVLEPDRGIDCVEPAPPVGVPTGSEAEARMVELLGRWGIEADQVAIDTYADEWNANVTATLLLEGQRTPLTWGVTFGGGGEVLYANGVLADVERVADYPRIGTAAAFERLQTGGYWWGGGVGMADTSVVRSEEGSSDVVIAEETIDGETIITDVPAPAPDDIAVDVMPVDPGEPLVVTVTGVEEELWMLWDADGTVWLVPGYAFISDDGGRNSVPAIADEYLDIQEPVPGTEIEPVPLPDTGTDPMVDETTDLPVEGGISALVGMTEADAVSLIDGVGWTSRISARDGESFVLTMDYRTDRVNLEIEDGIVTVATIG
jgi:hypothetical protein